MKKVLLGLLVIISAGVGGAWWWLQGNLDGLIKDAIVHYGSEMTGAKVRVGTMELRTKDGQAFIRKLHIGNPSGFKTAHALEVDEVEVAIDLASLTGRVVRIRKIAIKAPDVIYEKGSEMTNFDAIQKNIATYLGQQDKQVKKEDAAGKKLIVDALSVSNAKAHASAAFMDGKTVSLPLPDILLRDLGKSKGGLAPGELGQAVAQALRQQLAIAFSFDRLSKPLGDAAGKAANAIKGLFSK